MRPIMRRMVWGFSLLVIVALVLAVAAIGTSRSVFSSGRLTVTPTLSSNICNASAPNAFVGDGIGANFPCPPLRSAVLVATPIGMIPVVHYISDFNGARYDTMVADYSSVYGGDLTGIISSIVLDRTVAASMDEFIVKQQSSTSIKMNALEGRYVVGNDGTHAVAMKVFVKGKKLYRIAIYAPQSDIGNSVYTAFLDSFMISGT